MLRRTSSWRRICLYSGQNGRCSTIVENSQIGMSRHLDSSTTTQMAQIMVQYGRPSRSSWAKSVWSSFGRTIMGKAIWESSIKIRLGEGFQLGMLIRTLWKRIILICVCGWHKNWLERNKNLDPMWKVLDKEVDLGEPTSLLDHVYLGCTQRQCEVSKNTVDNYRTMFESRFSAEGVEKLPFPRNLRISSWSYDMEGHAKKCVERYCELANKTTQQLYKVSTHALMTITSKKKKNWNLLETCHKYAPKLRLTIWIMFFFVSSKANSSRQEALLCIFEDNDAVIKMIKERSLTMRHVSRNLQSCSSLVVW